MKQYDSRESEDIMARLVILGFGGYGRTVADIAEQLGYTIQFLDDSIQGYSLFSYTDYIDPDTSFIPAFGNNSLRMKWIERIQNASATLATLIHPTAYITPTAKIKDGVVILPKAVVNTGVIVEKGCIVNIGSIVDHDVVLEEGVHLAPGAIVKGENRIKSGTKVDSGMVISARQFPFI